MRIRFLGLITHFLEPSNANRGFVVLPKATDHDARLIVQDKDIDGHSDTDSSGADNILVQCFDLGDRVVSFPVIEVINRRLLKGVPELRKIGGGSATVHADVFSKTPNAVLRAFVNLPGGRYGIEDFFALHGTFNSVDFVCMPRTVTLDVRATAPVTVTGLASALTLKPWATVTIANLESTLVAAGEFRNYANLFDPPLTTLIRPTESTTRACPHGSSQTSILKCPDQPLQVATVECSNSQYP